MDDRNAFTATPLAVPTLAQLTELYRRATAAKDPKMQGLAEQAVLRLAVAEAASAEAATLAAFAQSVKG
jgi:hypothetical protein